MTAERLSRSTRRLLWGSRSTLLLDSLAAQLEAKKAQSKQLPTEVVEKIKKEAIAEATVRECLRLLRMAFGVLLTAFGL